MSKTAESRRVPAAEVERLIAEARNIDPGLRNASLAPIGSRERDRHERIRDHYIAYGIRHALDNLGLLPDA